MINQSNKRVRRRTLIGGLLVALCLGGGSAAKADSKGAMSSCDDSVVVNNYLAALEGLPKQRGFARSGKLGFGPGALRIYPPRTQLIVAGLDRIESSGMLSNRSHSTQALRWVAESRLERLDGQGVPVRRVKAKEQRIGTVAAFAHRQFGFGGDIAPGIYRLQVSFSKNRALLGTFREYFRVVKARSSLHLRAPSNEVPAGSTIALRVENRGTVSSTYSFYPHLYAPDGSEVPVDHGIGGDVKPLLPAGALSSCIEIPLPDSLSAGDYRVKLDVKDRTMKHGEPISTSVHIAAP
jgi:hypothetical protein